MALKAAEAFEAELDRRDRRPEVVGDGREQSGAHGGSLALGARGARFGAEPVAFEQRLGLQADGVDHAQVGLSDRDAHPGFPGCEGHRHEDRQKDVAQAAHISERRGEA